MIKSITITCPTCKNKFESTNILSFNTFNDSPDFSSEPFQSTRKCPNCKKIVNVEDRKNWIYTADSFSGKFKKWLAKLIP